MLLRTFLITSLLMGCSRADDGEAKIPLSWYKAKRDVICQEFDPATIDRCDRSTFHVLMNAMCNKPVPTEYEYPSGKWNRDVAPCWPTDSRSETSQDTYLSLIMSQDKDALKRAAAYAEPNGWETGIPEGGVGNIRALVPLLEDYRAPREIPNIFQDHRGHLTALWIWADARKHGGAIALEREWLKKIYKETSDSPFFSCMYRRFNKMDQRVTMEKLDRISTKKNTYGWGGSFSSLHFVMTTKCLEGL